MDATDAFRPGSSPFGDWLTSVGLGHLEPVLRAHDIAEDVIAILTEQDLAQMGLSMGDRKRLMRAIARLTDVRPSPSEVIAAPPAIAHTELRQLTIMFCDLVDATSLSARLPPESWREVVLAYQQTAVAVITRHGGSVAQYLGDGLLVYFGYPKAQEDAAVRAAQAGLELGQAMSALRIVLDPQTTVSLQTRIGVHTGMVVIGDIGAGERREQLALGETPNIAARLQEMAAPGTLLITDATRRLAAGSFDYEDLGLRTLKGIQEQKRVWRVVACSAAPSRFDARTGAGLAGDVSPLVGRTQELGLLLDRWQAATQGQGQVVLISGEAGMGKSRMLKELCERLGDDGQRAVSFQCAAHLADGAFLALAQAIARVLHFKPDMPDALKMESIEALLCDRYGLTARHAALMATLLGVQPDAAHTPAQGSPHQREQDIVDMMADLVVARARLAPMLLLFEDAHWADPASLAALERIVMDAKDLPLLLVITHRPEFVPGFDRLAHVTALKMPGLRRSEVATLVSRLMGGQTLPAAMAQRILRRTDGVPLFVEELTRALLEQPSPRQQGISAFLPATLRDSLMARLERHPGAKELAQIGAAIGREFSHDLLKAVCDPIDEGRLQQGIAALLDAGLILRIDTPQAEGGTQAYVFRHALVQDAAYDTLPSSRKEALHARILQAIPRCHPETAQAQPAWMARHAMAAGQPDVALPLWRRASELALGRLALHEAASHLHAALLAVARLPASAERDRTELRLHTALGMVHVLGKGWAAPEVEEAYERASRLAGAATDDGEAIQPLWGLCMHHLMQGRIVQAQLIGQRMQLVADRSGGGPSRRMMDLTHVLLQAQGGHVDKVDALMRQALARPPRDVPDGAPVEPGKADAPSSHALSAIDLQLMAMVQGLQSRWIAGDIDTAADLDAAYAEIENYALALDHPCSLAWASIPGAMVYLLADRPDELLPRLHRGQQIAQTHGFAWLAAMATFAMGWCQTRIDDLEEGAAMMEKGIAAYKATGAGLMLPCFEALLAEALGHAGRDAQALDALSRALRDTAQGGERWHEAELLRIRGELLARGDTPDLAQARQAHEQAIAIAGAQGAARWQARAMQALASLPSLPRDESGHSADSPS